MTNQRTILASEGGFSLAVEDDGSIDYATVTVGSALGSFCKRVYGLDPQALASLISGFHADLGTPVDHESIEGDFKLQLSSGVRGDVTLRLRLLDYDSETTFETTAQIDQSYLPSFAAKLRLLTTRSPLDNTR